MDIVFLISLRDLHRFQIMRSYSNLSQSYKPLGSASRVIQDWFCGASVEDKNRCQ